MLNVRGSHGGDRGGALADYAALVVLAALILGALVVTGVPSTIASGAGNQICKIFRQGDCAEPQKTTAAGNPEAPGTPDAPDTPGGQTQTKPRDPLQLQAVAAKGGQPEPNPEPNPPPDPNPPDWGPSTGAGPGNPGVGRSGDLPRDGENPYEPPKSGRGKPVKIPGQNAWKDKNGRTWKWDTLHRDHWDVTDKDGKHINVNPDGSEARKTKPKPTPAPSATGQKKGKKGKKGNKGDGKTNSWIPWGVGAAGAGGLLWWGGKLLSPACGPFAPACALVL